MRSCTFFDISENFRCFDEKENRRILKRVFEGCCFPAKGILPGLIRKHGGRVKVACSISGILLDSLERYHNAVVNVLADLTGRRERKRSSSHGG